jgi:hypothetical protein
MVNVVYISDFFMEQNLGGAEICDDVIISSLQKKDVKVQKILSRNVTINTVISNKNSFFVLSNFTMMRPEVLDYIISNKIRYIIYEHDHKYLKSRNPADFKDYLAPKDQVVNYDLYKNAVKVVAQTNFHKEIIEKNLNLQNIITFSTNFWLDKQYNFMEQMSKRDKFEITSIMESSIWHKNTIGSIEYCKKNKKPFVLIRDSNYFSFLEKLGTYSSFIFMPKTPETFSRTCAEARMMNCQVIANNNIGCVKEQWFKDNKGIDLINYLKNSNQDAVIKLLEIAKHD